MPAGLTLAVGSTALSIAVGAVTFIAAGVARRRLHWTWLRATSLLLCAGVGLGWIGRVTTAGSVGANIGGGIALFPGLAVVGLLVGFAVRDVAGRIASNRRTS